MAGDFAFSVPDLSQLDDSGAVLPPRQEGREGEGRHEGRRGDDEASRVEPKKRAKPRRTTKTRPAGPSSATSVIGLVAWGIFAVALSLFHRARPEIETMYERFRGRSVRGQWDDDLVPWILGLVVLELVLLAGGMTWALAAERRFAGGLAFSLVVGAATLVGLLVLL